MHKYRQIKILGKGGFGCAVLVTPKDRPKEQYVMKEVKLAGLPKKEQDAALKEASMLKSLHHPNIVSFVESFTEGGKLYIVMEYADGGDLAGRIAQIKKSNISMSEDEALNIFVQICLALKHMHDRRIIHRDLKAANVFLMKAGVVKLGDFGIARSLSSSADLAKTQIGTPYYLSPEICCDKPYGRKTDMWAAGVVLYECLTLTLPFSASDLPRLVTKILSGIYPPLPSRLSTGVRKLVADLLQRDPKMRPTVTALLRTEVLRDRMMAFLTTTLAAREFGQALALSGGAVASSEAKAKDEGDKVARDAKADAKADARKEISIPAARRSPSPAVGSAKDTPVAARPVPAVERRSVAAEMSARAEAARAEAAAAAEAYKQAQVKLQQQRLEQQRATLAAEQKAREQRLEQQRAAAIEADLKAKERAKALLDAAAEDRRRRLAEMVERERKLQKERADRAEKIAEKEALDRKKRLEIAKKERERWVEERRKEWVAASPSANDYKSPTPISSGPDFEVYAPPRRQASASSLLAGDDASVPAGGHARRVSSSGRASPLADMSPPEPSWPAGPASNRGVARPAIVSPSAASHVSAPGSVEDPAAQEFRALLADEEFRSFYADFMRRKGSNMPSSAPPPLSGRSRADSQGGFPDDAGDVRANPRRPPLASRGSSTGVDYPVDAEARRELCSPTEESYGEKRAVRGRADSAASVERSEAANGEAEYLRALEVARRSYVDERRRLKEQQRSAAEVSTNDYNRADSRDAGSAYVPSGDDKEVVRDAARQRRAKELEDQEERLKEAMREAYRERKALAEAKQRHAQEKLDAAGVATTQASEPAESKEASPIKSAKVDPAAEAAKREEELRKAAAEAWAERKALQERAKKLAQEAMDSENDDTTLNASISASVDEDGEHCRGMVIVMEGAKRSSGPPASFLARQHARKSKGPTAEGKPPIPSAKSLPSRVPEPVPSERTIASASAVSSTRRTSGTSEVPAAAGIRAASPTAYVSASPNASPSDISYVKDPILHVDAEGRPLGPLQVAMLQRRHQRHSSRTKTSTVAANQQPTAPAQSARAPSPKSSPGTFQPIAKSVSIPELRKPAVGEVKADRAKAVIQAIDDARSSVQALVAGLSSVSSSPQPPAKTGADGRSPSPGGAGRDPHAPGLKHADAAVDDLFLSADTGLLVPERSLFDEGLEPVTKEVDLSCGSDAAPVSEDDAAVVRLEVDVADMKDEIEKALALSDGDDDDLDEEDDENQSSGDAYADMMPSIDTILTGLRAAGLGATAAPGRGMGLLDSAIPEDPADALSDGYSSEDGQLGGASRSAYGSESESSDLGASMNRDEFRPLRIGERTSASGKQGETSDTLTAQPSVASDPGMGSTTMSNLAP